MPTLTSLIQGMKAKGVLTTLEVEEAFMKVDRRFFVPDYLKDQCYGDYPLPIGEAQTISQPSTVAFMLELLSVNKGDRVLDVGAGSCWTTALLASLTGDQGKIIGLERIESLAVYGEKNLEKVNVSNAQVYHANGYYGWEEQAPYDRILVSAATDQVPVALLNQLKNGGRLVIPLSDLWGNMLLITKDEKGNLQRKTHAGFVFVPFIEEDEKPK